jgi:hypothetical protein
MGTVPACRTDRCAVAAADARIVRSEGGAGSADGFPLSWWPVTGRGKPVLAAIANASMANFDAVAVDRCARCPEVRNQEFMISPDALIIRHFSDNSIAPIL